MRKRSILTVKIAQIRQNIWNFIVRKLKLQEMANFGDYPEDSNLETGRNGSKSGVSRVIRESWQPCGENIWHFMMLPLWFPWALTSEIPYWWHVTTRILVVTHLRCRISVLGSQMSFCGETTVVALQNVNCFLRLLTLKNIQKFFKKTLGRFCELHSASTEVSF